MFRSRAFVLSMLWAFAAVPAAGETILPLEGLRDATPRRFALTGARIVTEPGRVIEEGTIFIEEGRIVAVERGRHARPGFSLRDVSGLMVFPGLIDLASDVGLPAAARASALTPLTPPPPIDQQQAEPGARHWSRRVRPEFSLAAQLVADGEKAKSLRGLGFTAALSLPEAGIFRGQAAFVGLGEGGWRRQLLKPDALQVIGFDFAPFGSGEYPNALMGAIALIRQTLFDGRWHGERLAHWRAHPGSARPEANLALEALAPLLAGRQPALFVLRDELDYARATRIAEEAGIEAWYLGSGFEYRLLPRLIRERPRLILPLAFPDVPAVAHPEREQRVSLAELSHWEEAPANPARLHASGLRFALSARGLRQPERRFWPNLRRAIAAGLPPEAALAALTTTPAAWLGLGDRMGRIAPGYRADLLIAEGDPFLDQEARLIELWIEGERFALAPEDDPRGRWRLEFAGEVAKPVEVAIGGSAERPEILPTEGETGRPIRLERSEGRFAAVLPAARLGLGEGQASFGFAIIAGRLIGELALAATPKLGVTGARVAARTREAKPVEVRSLSPSPRYPAGEYGREGPPPQPEVLLLRGATIWTMDDALGRIEGGDLLVERGRIRAVGRGLQVPPRALVLDVTGKHLTPGIVDAHSHTAIAGGLNEASHAVTSEVRIADVIDPTDINLYRQLAGGVTAALLLHGSANPIGGQSAVIKLRWGESAEGLLLADAPPGIKFALGENVKQSNWGDAFRVRYPQTRMGVEQIFEDRFSAAREYLEARRRQRKGDPPLRRDLRLEALAEILEGKRLVHIHSYVQSEIAMFARLAERWGIRVATFQHVLEGYKVSEEIRRIGAGASSFADWWAFKFEVYDAIPHNAAMLTRAGVLTSINSDSNEHARRLNTEAAKAVRYGGLSEVEALALVTRNPAEQLGLGQRIGRLAPGWDADFVVWSGHPLSTFSIAEQTWIDGRRYFDREEDAQWRTRDAAERQRLLALAREALARGEGAAEEGETGASSPERPRSFRPRLLPDIAVHLAALRGIYHEGWDLDTCSLQEHRHRTLWP
ncbi:MAG: periplasmic amidohydrolase [Lysobacterales bacterium]|nr:MAG: periplasmic amidohydrolase [Xanthomonadales bacterium]